MPATPATRLSASDALSVHAEAAAPTHLGGVLLLEGGAPSYDAVAALVVERLHALPRWRERLAPPPGRVGRMLRPCWVEDPAFDLALHLRHAGLPRPRSEAQLAQLAGRILSAPLDRRRPLWELHLVDALEGDRFAVVVKVHPALAGEAGAGIVAALLESGPAAPLRDRTGRLVARRTVPPVPSEAQVLATSALGQAREVGGTLRGALDAVRRDPAAVALSLARGAREVTDRALEARLATAPPSPYDGPAGAPRRVAWARASARAVRRAAVAARVSEDAVVLAAVTSALQAHCARRGHAPDVLRALVRTGDGREGPALLPLGAATRAERLERLDDATRALLPAGARERPVAPRAVNLAITAFPDTGRDLRLLGRPLREVVPFVPLPCGHALSIATIRCADRLAVGLLGCAATLPDLDDLVLDVERALLDLTQSVYGRHVRRRPSNRLGAPTRGVMNFGVR